LAIFLGGNHPLLAKILHRQHGRQTASLLQEPPFFGFNGAFYFA
jgi:hypothetical protein